MIIDSFVFIIFILIRRPLSSTLFPYTTLFRSVAEVLQVGEHVIGIERHHGVADLERGPRVGTKDSAGVIGDDVGKDTELDRDRKSTRLNSSHVEISYAVFCLKKKKHIESF